MPQMRQDPTTKEWVILSSERAKRPDDFRREKPVLNIPPFKKGCPFCPGNEHLTPPETLAYRRGGPSNGPGWWVRVVPNKYPALTLDGSLERKEEKGFFRLMDGVGVHEVVIGSPIHNQVFSVLDDYQASEVLLAYRERYLALREDPRIKLIIIFKNHGPAAGTSLEHTHSQIVGTSIVPTNIRKKLQEAARHYDDHGVCVYCEMIEEELSSRERILEETDEFMVLHPFASRFPFETWIVPKKHHASFGSISVEDSKKFAILLKTTLHGINSKLNDPDYNYVIHTAPVKDEGEDYYHWHLQIIPRLTTTAGFEMGSGMYINVSFPEQTARFMRE